MTCLALMPAMASAQAILTEGTNLSPDISQTDGRIAFDLLGNIWIMDGNGGQASKLENAVLPARTPRWSPSGQQLLYESSTSEGNRLWLHDLITGQPRLLIGADRSDQNAAWHPSGERIIFSAARNGSRLDLWELDLATELRWRLTDLPGDETDAAWSADGRHLAYVSHDGDSWRLLLRRHGKAEIELVHSANEIRAPSWRPDGSLITYFAATGAQDDKFTLDMVILADAPISRTHSANETDYFLTPVSWENRQRMIYAAGGKILSKDFDSLRAQPVHFRAVLDRSYADAPVTSNTRELPIIDPPDHRYVIRAARVYDGVGNRYLENIDVVTDGARIETLGSRREWPDAIVLDLGNATIMPGFIDVFSALPAGSAEIVGANLLAYGVTTVVSATTVVGLDETLWHSEQLPGPRLLRAADSRSLDAQTESLPYLISLAADTGLGDTARELVRDAQHLGIPVLARSWTVGLGLGADLLLGANALPASPSEQQYQDMRFASAGGQIVLVSGLADGSSEGLQQLLASRQAQHFKNRGGTPRRFATPPRLNSGNTAMVVGSLPNGLPAGLALHAEMRAMADAGMSPQQILRAAGADAARALRLGGQLGTIVPGGLADLVIVSGDPLADISAALNIVGVVRNGRFFSLISLLERTN